jgi:hypothetical protein
MWTHGQARAMIRADHLVSYVAIFTGTFLLCGSSCSASTSDYTAQTVTFRDESAVTPNRMARSSRSLTIFFDLGLV